MTLLGQNVNSYGRDLRGDDRRSFAELLREIDAVEGIERIRYTSPHPKDMKEDVIVAHAECEAVCEHIHLPLQSGSSRILKAMRRTYDRERYLDRVALIREHLPDVALTTDIIVGFPGETEADFEETLEVVEEVGYDGAFTFVFSPRRGTEAAELDGMVPHPVKKERMGRLVEAVQRRARERAERFVGRTDRRPRRGPEPHRPDPAAGPEPPQQGGQLRGHGRAGRDRRGRDRIGDLADAARRPRSCSRASAEAVVAGDRDLRPDRRRQDGGGDRAGRAAPRAGARTRSPSPATRSRSTAVSRSSAAPPTRASGSASSIASSASPTSARSSAPAGSRSSPGPRSTSCSPPGRTPIVVGGTGLYMRAALADLDLRPPVPTRRSASLVEAQIAELGPAAMHAELDPDVGERIHPNDRKRVATGARAAAGRPRSARARPRALDGAPAPPDGADRNRRRPRGAGRPDRPPGRRDDRRRCRRGGRAAARAAGASTDGRLGARVRGAARGDAGAVKAAHRRYARRQMTWLRRMEGVEAIDRTGTRRPRGRRAGARGDRPAARDRRLGGAGAVRTTRRRQPGVAIGHDVVDQAVLLRLLGGEEAVALHVLVDLLDRSGRVCLA